MRTARPLGNGLPWDMPSWHCSRYVDLRDDPVDVVADARVYVRISRPGATSAVRNDAQNVETVVRANFQHQRRSRISLRDDITNVNILSEINRSELTNE